MFRWYNPIAKTTTKEHYYNTVFQFEAHSSPKLFSDFTTAARHIMHYNGATCAEHYLDDYITMGAARSEEYCSNLEIMTCTWNDLGISLNSDEMCLPSMVMEYLSIILVSSNINLHCITCYVATNGKK